MLTDAIQNRLNHYHSENLLRKRFIIESQSANQIVIQNKNLTNFCSNDYLGMADHPRVKKAFHEALAQYGVGSTASALVSGYLKIHRTLEEKFAETLNRERAILFNSGYQANLGVITTFANRNSTIIADKLCHASLIDGIILSRAKHFRYRHNDLDHAQQLLNKRNERGSLIITESVNSMEGDICDAKALAKIARDHSAMLLMDDAHGIGVIGKRGKGICDYHNLNQDDIDGLITPFGKALGGMGAVVTGKKDFIEALAQFARTYIYTTALPPAICYSTLESLHIFNDEPWRIAKLHQLIDLFLAEAKKEN